MRIQRITYRSVDTQEWRLQERETTHARDDSRGFESASHQTKLGRKVNWQQRLIILGMIDIKATRRDRIVCMQPDEVNTRKDLAYKTLLLQKHAGIDPCVDEVLKQMQENLSLHNAEEFIDELLESADGKIDRVTLDNWLDEFSYDLAGSPRTILALEGRAGLESVKQYLTRTTSMPPRANKFRL